MTPAILTPPPESTEVSPHAADLHAAASPFSVRVPLGRPQRREPTGRPTRNAILVSAALHLLLAAAFVLAPARREPRLADSGGDGGTLEKVEYLDVGEWPQGGGSPSAGGTAALPAEAAAENAVTAAAADSAAARTTAPAGPSATAFPSRVPTRIPGVPAGPAGRGRPGGAPGAGAAQGAGAGQGQGQGNAIGNNPAGGRLGPGYGDRRLIVRPEAVPERQMSDHERYMRRLADRLEAVNDSVAEEAGRQHRARNWIVKDKNGREWGIAEGGVPVVAGRRISGVPIAPPINVDRDTENRERARTRQREEIDRQADDIERDRVFRERTRAIRERRDKERREREERDKAGEGTTP